MPKTKDKIKVVPIKKVLDGYGTVWEYILDTKGWNKLDKKDRYGIIVGCFENKGFLVYDIYFPKLDITLKNIFPDEIKLYA